MKYIFKCRWGCPDYGDRWDPRCMYRVCLENFVTQTSSRAVCEWLNQEEVTKDVPSKSSRRLAMRDVDREITGPCIRYTTYQCREQCKKNAGKNEGTRQAAAVFLRRMHQL